MRDFVNENIQVFEGEKHKGKYEEKMVRNMNALQ